MITLLAIDPGAKQGWAVFAGGVLVAVGKGAAPMRAIDVLVIERPESRGGRTNTPVDDLITLAIRAGETVGRHRAHLHPAGTVRWATANEWKGQTPKPISHGRAIKALTPDERALVEGVGPDALDAVAIGLWYLER